jgi:hypothetical protein
MRASKLWLVQFLSCLIITLAPQGRGVADLRLPPTPTLFLPHMVEVMQKYHDHHGEYANEWRLLDFEYNNERPKQQNKELFQDAHYDYVYKIVSADRDHFLIQALAWDDQVAYEIRDGMKKAVRLPGADEPPRLHPEMPEPAHFLPVAAAAMRVYHDKYKKYPAEWDKLEITYSAVAFRPYNLHVHTQANEGDVWRPRGCHYVYRIVQQPDDHFLIQAETDSIGGEIKYEIRDGMKEAKCLKGPENPKRY